MRFCQQAGLIPLPLRENTLCLFVAHLVEQGLQHSSIRLYLSSLRHLQISSGLPDPFTAGAFPRLHYVLRGVQRSVSPGSPTRLPITPHLLQLLLQVWTSRPMSYEVRLLWAACCVGFFGFLRVGEFTVRNSGSLSTDILSIQDVARDATNPPSFIRLHLRCSKTDPFKHGVFIYLGATGQRICPVSALLSFLVVRPQNLSGPLFQYPDGSPLTRTHFIKEVRSALTQAGIDSSHYNGHSFRIGAATAAGQAGIPDHIIKMLGRWESSAYTLYIRTSGSQLASISAHLLASGGGSQQ